MPCENYFYSNLLIEKNPCKLQVQGRVTTISNTVGDLEDLTRQRDVIKKWITEHHNIVLDFKSRPAKLRPEATALEMSQMNDLRSKIIEKQGMLDDLELTQTCISSDSSDTDIRQQMNQLENEVTEMIDSRTDTLAKVEQYRTKLQSVYTWFDTIIKQLEKCDKVDSVDSRKKKEEGVQNLWSQFEDARSQVDDLRTTANVVMLELSSLDIQQVEEQLRSVEKKYSDLQKRVGKKMQVIEMTRKGYEDFKTDVVTLQEWLTKKHAYINDMSSLGFTSKDTENRLLEINVSMLQFILIYRYTECYMFIC